MKYKTRCWCWTPARPAAPYIKTAQCDLWKRGQGDVCVLIYSSHLVYEWTTTRLQRPAHILRNRPTTGCLPVKMCSQCTLYSTVDQELVLLSGMSENMERKDSHGIIQTLVFDNCFCIFHVAPFRSSKKWLLWMTDLLLWYFWALIIGILVCVTGVLWGCVWPDDSTADS